MNQLPSLGINFVRAIIFAALLLIAPIAFAQQVNYYNSINPNPGGNPSVTNTIIPDAVNVPTGNAGTNMTVNVNGSSTNSSTPGVPNTGVPGVPNTGEGGDASNTMMVLALSALIAGT